MGVGLMVAIKDKEMLAGMPKKDIDRMLKEVSPEIEEKWKALGYRAKHIVPFTGDPSQYSHVYIGEVADADVAFKVRQTLWEHEDYLPTIIKYFEFNFFIGPIFDLIGEDGN